MVDKSDIFKNPVQELEQRTRSNLALAVEAVSGDIGADPLVVFPAQGKAERRADIEFDITNLTLEQEQAFRSAMGKLGPGRESNQTPAVVGLTSGFTALLEGGQAHKMVAELNIVTESEVLPGAIILSADAERQISDSEKDLTSQVLKLDKDEVGETEYEVAKQVLKSCGDFIESPEEILPFGYTGTGELTHEPNGQFIRVGEINGSPVVVMRVDREWYEAEDGSRKFKRINNSDKMKIVAGIENGSDIGFVTSATYLPTVAIDAMKASKATGVAIKVPNYGTAELARVKGEEQPTPPALNQLAGEAYKIAKKLQQLT